MTSGLHTSCDHLLGNIWQELHYMETARKLYCSLLPLSHMPRSPSPYRSSSRRRYRDLDRASVSPSRSPPARRYRSRSPPSPGGRYYSRSPPARRPKRSPSRSLSRSRSPPRYRSRRRSPSPRGRRGRRGRSPRGKLDLIETCMETLQDAYGFV